MYDKLIRWVYDLHILIQALVSLAFPIALGVGVSYICVCRSWTGTWIYAVLVPVGALLGLCTMVRFVLRAAAQARRVEKEAEQRRTARRRTHDETQ